MFRRPLLFVGILVAAVVVPYVMLDKKLGDSAKSTWSGLVGKAEQKEDDLLTAIHLTAAKAAEQTKAAALAPAVPIEQVFRFEITPDWIISHWPRVSTNIGDPKQLGIRVALLTGTRSDDIAGSLTYYFDDHHQLQRITFTGLTGDPRRLLAMVVTPYGLKSQPTTGAARYIAGSPDSPTSEVTVRHLPVLVGDTTGARAEVSIDLRRADALGWKKKAEQEPEPKIMPSSYRRW